MEIIQQIRHQLMLLEIVGMSVLSKEHVKKDLFYQTNILLWLNNEFFHLQC